MTKDARSKYLVWSLMLLPNAAVARPVRYVWSNVPEADYYQGTLSFGQERATFRTPSTWILVPEGSTVEVNPFTHEGRALPDAVITPRLELDLQEKSAPAPKPKEVPPPPKKTTKKPPKVSRKGERKTLQAESSGSTTLRSYLGVRLGLGRDRLTSSGGLYGYSGQSNIAPVSLDGLWAVPPNQEWGISADLSYHSFVVSNEVEPVDGGEGGQQKARFTRLAGWLGGIVRVIGAEKGEWPQAIDLSLGLSYVQLPTLKVNDTSTGQALLVNAKSTRIGLRGNYEWAATPRVTLGVSVRYAPFSLDPSSPSDGYGIHLYCGYKVAQGHALDFGVTSSADEISSKSSCDDGVDCPTKTTSTSRVTDLRVGYRVGF